MKKTIITFVLVIMSNLFICLTTFANATEPDHIEYVQTNRVDVTYSNWWMPIDSAKATIVLFPGGSGGFGYDVASNQPHSNNFLVRSREYFRQAGFNVLIVGKPQDVDDLDNSYRISKEHISDLRNILLRVRELSPLPIWLISTSRGTISAAATTINNPDLVNGLVLTSSIVNRHKIGNIPSLDIETIKVPTLLFHHNQDACIHCAPSEVEYITNGLKNAPIKKQIMVDGGSGVSGNPCEPQHYHGYIGMEVEAVKIITDWISNPSN